MKSTLSTRILALVIGLQVFNISLNQNDYLLGKVGNGIAYVNEIETVVEFIAEFCITGKDVIPESQVPGGTLGFEEEEEKHLQPQSIKLNPQYYPEHMFKGLQSPYDFNIKVCCLEIVTPPPQA